MTVSVVSETFVLADAVPNSGNKPAPHTNPPRVLLVQAGAQAARIERVQITLVNSFGESVPSPETVIPVPAGFVIKVRPPFVVNAPYPAEPLSWNVYVTTGAAATETKQNTTPLQTLLTDFGGVPEEDNMYWQEPNTGLIAGSALPSTTAAPNPALQSGLAGLINTPPVPYQDIHQDFTNTNTGRTQMATQTFLAKFSGIS